MTVLELISGWTEEERIRHADLIMECLKRERFLEDLKGKIKKSQEELIEDLNFFSAQLNQLAQAADEIADQIQTIYLNSA